MVGIAEVNTLAVRRKKKMEMEESAEVKEGEERSGG